MSWSKLKTIIIYILLLLNLFLLALVGMNRLRARHYQTTALSEAAAVLARNNIQVQWEQLPREMKLPVITLTRDPEKEGQLVRTFLGEDATAAASGGGMYVYTGHKVAGTANFRGNGEFSVTCSEPVSQSVTPREMMRQLGLETGRMWEEEDSATAEQSLNNVPVYSAGSSVQGPAGITLTYDESGQPYAASGRLYLGKATEEQEETVSVSTALMAFLNFVVENGDVCGEILDMSPVYRAGGDPVRLTTAWLIRTDTGSYFVDAVSTEVSRAPAE